VMLGTRRPLKLLSRFSSPLSFDIIHISFLSKPQYAALSCMGCLESHERVGAIHQERNVEWYSKFAGDERSGSGMYRYIRYKQH
jgi:hypothetical protein